MTSPDQHAGHGSCAPNRRARLALAIAAIAMLAGAAQLYATTLGLGVTPDSRSYIEAARRLFATGSLTITDSGVPAPLTHYPPLLSIVLAGAGFVGVDPLVAARWLNLLLLIANIALSGVLIDQLSASSVVLTLAGVLMVAGVNSSFLVYSWAWSEPLFIFLLLLAFACLTRYASSRQRLPLVLAGLFVGLAWLTRYVGGVFAASIALWLLLQPGRPRSRLGRLAAFLVASGWPIGLWSLRNILLTGRPNSRAIVFHPIAVDTLRASLSTGFVRLCLLLGALAVAALLLRVDLRQAWRRVSPRSVIVCLWLSLLAYLLGLVASLLFVDARTPLDARIFAPAVVLLIISTFSSLGYVSVPARHPLLVKGAAGLLYGAYMLFGLMTVAGMVRQSHQDGGWYNSSLWRDSATMAFVRQLPADRLIYSNGSDAIYMLAGRSAHALPSKTDTSLQLNPNYPSEAAAMRRALAAGGVVILFDNIQRPYFPTRDEITHFMPPLAAQPLDDGVVLTVNP